MVRFEQRVGRVGQQRLVGGDHVFGVVRGERIRVEGRLGDHGEHGAGFRVQGDDRPGVVAERIPGGLLRDRVDGQFDRGALGFCLR